MKKITYAFLGVLLLMGMSSVNAATFSGGERYELNSSDVVSENLYVGGGSVSIAGTVNGDLITAGGDLSITGTVTEDLIIAGGTINIIGDIGEDVRVAGGNIAVLGNVGGELVGAGGQITVLSSAVIQGDLSLSGGNIRVEAPVNGDVEINGGEVYINGPIKGDLLTRGGEVELGPNAVIQGDFNHYSKNEAVFAEGATVLGEQFFHKIDLPIENENKIKGLFAFLAGLAIFSQTLIIGLAAILFVYLWKKWAGNLIADVSKNFWKRALLGFAVVFLTPVLAILLMITVVGLIPAGLLVLGYILALILTKIFTGILTAGFLNKYVFKKPVNHLDWWKILLGVFVFQLVKAIPFVGWPIAIVIFFSSLGWFTNVMKDVLMKGRK